MSTGLSGLYIGETPSATGATGIESIVGMSDIGCVSIHDDINFDCSSRLQQLIQDLENNDRRAIIDLEGTGWRFNSTVTMQRRTGICITGCGGAGGITEGYPLNRFTQGSDNHQGGPAGRMYWGGAFGGGPILRMRGFGNYITGVTFMGKILNSGGGQGNYGDWNYPYVGERAAVGVDVTKGGEGAPGTGKMLWGQTCFYNFDSGIRYGVDFNANADNQVFTFLEGEYCDQLFDLADYSPTLNGQSVDFSINYVRNFFCNTVCKARDGGKFHIGFLVQLAPGVVFDIAGDALDSRVHSIWTVDKCTVDNAIKLFTWNGIKGVRLVKQGTGSINGYIPRYTFNNIAFADINVGETGLTGEDKIIFDVTGPAMITLSNATAMWEDSLKFTASPAFSAGRGCCLRLLGTTWHKGSDANPAKVIRAGSDDCTVIWRDNMGATGRMITDGSVETSEGRVTPA